MVMLTRQPKKERIYECFDCGTIMRARVRYPGRETVSCPNCESTNTYWMK